MKILAISDTHGFHEDFKDEDFKDVDMVIFSGDCSNSKGKTFNFPEVSRFLAWFEGLDVKYKIMVAGNHDTSIEAGLWNPKEFKNIIYLQHESVEIEGLKIFGSPYTPEFFNWAFNVPRNKLDEYWKDIPEGTDILVTHGPPLHVLDGVSIDGGFQVQHVGDETLLQHVKRVKPRFHLFGHIHNNGTCVNQGQYINSEHHTIFINASCVTDGHFNRGLTSKGVKFECNNKNKERKD